MELGLSALVLPLRHPVLVAKQAATLDIISDGKLILGVCKGSRVIKSSFDALGVPYEKRWSIFKEYLAALRELFTTSPASFDGKYVRFSDIELYPKPRKSRILLGVGMTPEGIKASATLGDGWLPGHRPPDEISQGILRIRSERKKVGLSMDHYEVGLNLYTAIANSREEAIKKASGTVTWRARLGSFPGAESDVVERRALVGSTDYIISRIEQYREAGLDEIFHMIVANTFEEFKESMRLLSRDVLPSFRSG
jgi:alkanesulfonate monooxygenase SsuD/methylene tetrahydromethanopterin reductase-like flavin-dependent oxidoreductase (luciferase family)